MTNTQSIRVLIADDNAVVRRGLRMRLNHAEGIHVIGEASNGRDAVTIARRENATVVLMDLEMPGDGLKATRALAGPGVENPIRVIALTAHAEPAWVIQALESGAVGYILKHDLRRVTAAIEAAARGESPLSAGVAAPVIHEFTRRRTTDIAADESIGMLSPAELAAVTQLTRGRTSNEEIAAALFLSVNTVRSQLSSALRKTGLSDRTQLALWGVRRGLDRGDDIPPPQ